MKNEFPKYYLDKRIGLYHKLEMVDYVDIEKEIIYYRGIIMQHFGNKCDIFETCTFTHSKWDGWEEITEEEFNSKYYKMKAIAEEKAFPKYFYHPGRNNYIKAIEERQINGDSVYYCVIVEPKNEKIEGARQLSKWATDRDCICIPEEDYETAFNRVLNKIK